MEWAWERGLPVVTLYHAMGSRWAALLKPNPMIPGPNLVHKYIWLFNAVFAKFCVGYYYLKSRAFHIIIAISAYLKVWGMLIQGTHTHMHTLMDTHNT